MPATQPMPPAPPVPIAPAPGLAPIPVAPPVKKPRTGVIVGVTIGVILLIVLVVSVGGFAAYSLLNGHIPGLGGNGTSVASSATPTTSPVLVGAATPEAAVDAWFVAVSQGDLAAVRKTATPDFASNIDASMFEGRDAHTSYRVDNTDIQGDKATVDVQESPTDAAAQTATTFIVMKQTDGSWLVSQYVVAATGQPPGTSEAGTAIEPAAQTPVFDKTDAIDVVGTMLSGLKGTGSLSAAKAAATSRFKNANPGWIMKSSDYDFYVTGAKKQGDAWIVTVKEQWQSGAETASYTVVLKDGKGYVDRRNGLD